MVQWTEASGKCTDHGSVTHLATPSMFVCVSTPVHSLPPGPGPNGRARAPVPGRPFPVPPARPGWLPLRPTGASVGQAMLLWAGRCRLEFGGDGTRLQRPSEHMSFPRIARVNAGACIARAPGRKVVHKHAAWASSREARARRMGWLAVWLPGGRADFGLAFARVYALICLCSYSLMLICVYAHMRLHACALVRTSA